MATKSIHKNVIITNTQACHNLIIALENAENKKSKDVIIEKEIKTVQGDKIKELFNYEA